MSNGASTTRWRRITVVAILVAGLAAIIITNQHILLESLHTLTHLNWWWCWPPWWPRRSR